MKPSGNLVVAAAPKKSAFDDLHEGFVIRYIGDAFRFDQDKVKKFCVLTGDTNPIHTDPDRAHKAEFSSVVVPGFQVLSALGAVATEFFDGIIFLGMDKVKFHRPVYPFCEISVDFTCTRKKIVLNKKFTKFNFTVRDRSYHGGEENLKKYITGVTTLLFM